MSIYSFTFTLNLCFWEWKTGPQPHRQLDSVLSIDCLFCLLPHVTKHHLFTKSFFRICTLIKGVCVSGPNWDMAIVRKHKARLLPLEVWVFWGVWFVTLWQGPKYKHCSYFYLKFGGNRKYFHFVCSMNDPGDQLSRIHSCQKTKQNAFLCSASICFRCFEE